MAVGYCHRQYAESFAEVGQPRELPNCGGWLIERAIPGSAQRDGMGCYPLFDCCNWAGVPVDLAGLAEALVSVSLVVNPFADVAETDLRRWFDVVIPFKQHYVTDLRRPVDDLVGRQHRRNLQKARGLVQVDACPSPMEFLAEWCDLYEHLAARHGIAGVRAFSRAAFEKQLGVPGLVMFRASADAEIVGLHLWYVRDRVAYGHLGATSTRGYEVMASYALALVRHAALSFARRLARSGRRCRRLRRGGVGRVATVQSRLGNRHAAGFPVRSCPPAGRVRQTLRGTSHEQNVVLSSIP